jgi:hypothetical protein
LTATLPTGGLSNGIYINLSDNGVSVTYTGDGTSGIYFWGISLESGSATSYQPTTASNAIGTKIPATASGLIPSGLSNSASNPAGGHNGAETKIVLPFSGGEWAHGDALPSGWSSDVNAGAYRNIRHA